MNDRLSTAAPRAASSLRRARLQLCAGLALATTLAGFAQSNVTFTAAAGEKQTYQGLGVSNRRYTELSVAKRRELADLVIRDLRMNVLRVWIVDIDNRTAAEIYQEIKTDYIDSGQLADFRERGVDTLLASPAKGEFPPANIPAHSQKVAEVLRLLRVNDDVRFHALALSNEPQNWSDAQWVAHTHAMRSALDNASDASGNKVLRDVKLIAGCWASVDSKAEARTLALINDTASPNAWSKVAGVGTHSYGTCANNRIEDILRGPNGGNREWWQTESCDPGRELLGNDTTASKTAARFLNDMNNSVTHWIYFVGFMRSDSNDRDRGTKLVVYDPGLNQNLVFLKYHYLKLLTRAFDIGAKFRETSATRLHWQSADMEWKDPYKPATNAAVARNPDGSWAVGVANITGLPDETNSSGALLSTYRPATDITVTIRINELANTPRMAFRAQRVRKNGDTAAVDEIGVFEMVNGTLAIPQASLVLRPRELLTLRSSPTVLEPEADAFVRDGGFATQNFGGSDLLSVKLDTSGYHRRAFLRFDLSNVVAPITAARLRLVPVSIGSDQGFTTSVHLAADNWNEFSVTWNQQPSFNASAAFTLPTGSYVLNQARDFTITSIAQSEAAGDKRLSVAVRANQSGEQRFVSFGSTDHPTPASRPVLVLEY